MSPFATRPGIMLWPIINVNSNTKSPQESSIFPKSGVKLEGKLVDITLQVLMSESLLVNFNQDLSWPPNLSQPHRHVPRISWLESIADERQKTAWNSTDPAQRNRWRGMARGGIRRPHDPQGDLPGPEVPQIIIHPDMRRPDPLDKRTCQPARVGRVLPTVTQVLQDDPQVQLLRVRGQGLHPARPCCPANRRRNSIRCL